MSHMTYEFDNIGNIIVYSCNEDGDYYYSFPFSLDCYHYIIEDNNGTFHNLPLLAVFPDVSDTKEYNWQEITDFIEVNQFDLEEAYNKFANERDPDCKEYGSFHYTDCRLYAPRYEGATIDERVKVKDLVIDRYIQTDWDYPGLAGYFGWEYLSDCPLENEPEPDDWYDDDDEDNPTNIYNNLVEKLGTTCQYSGDGSIKCGYCGKSASFFIDSARKFLEKNEGDIVPDPGYFY